ncbi:metal-dependent phosphohydrolase [Desulfosarcina variabilis str. Montpellier]|uniref:HD domain-containing protein n=1 Tax=Desulfosarcina variabilis TaxID=2300 RepID=UPI003AFAB94B
MQIDTLNRLSAWFDDYTQSFLSGNAKVDAPLTLKIDHTARVRENIRELAVSLSLDKAKIHLAEAIALFHDVGRFEQYRCYQTFHDSHSVNHAKKGIDVLTQLNVLESLPDIERTIIIDAIRFHNVPALPDNNGSPSMLFMRLIRDADKLDIWKVFAEYFQNDKDRNPVMVQHFVDQPGWDPKMIEAILEKRTARFKNIKNINDYKLFQLSWVFGLHFPVSAVLARKRGHLAAIAGTLPVDDAIKQAVATVMAALERPVCE